MGTAWVVALGKCYWHLVDGGQGCCSVSHNAQDRPTAEDNRAPNEPENPAVREAVMVSVLQTRKLRQREREREPLTQLVHSMPLLFSTRTPAAPDGSCHEEAPRLYSRLLLLQMRLTTFLHKKTVF